MKEYMPCLLRFLRSYVSASLIDLQGPFQGGHSLMTTPHPFAHTSTMSYERVFARVAMTRSLHVQSYADLKRQTTVPYSGGNSRMQA